MKRERAAARIEALIDERTSVRSEGLRFQDVMVGILRDGFAILLDELDEGPEKRMIAEAMARLPDDPGGA